MSMTGSHFFNPAMRPTPAFSAALLLSACALCPQQQQGVLAPAPLPSIRPTAHLAQMEFDGHSEFWLCMPAACPALTPKTLASSPPYAALQPPVVSVTAEFLNVTKEIKPSSDATGAKGDSPFRATVATARKAVIVYFGLGAASLSAADKIILDGAVAAVRDTRHILIAGRTDSTGAAATNAQLAMARARSVMDYLHTRHPELAPILKLDAQGSCCYVASNSTKAGRGLNRRVDVLFGAEEEPAP